MLRSAIRKRVHRKIKEKIEFNEKRIQSYKTISVDRSEILLSDIKIYRSYGENYLNRLVKVYKVDNELVTRLNETILEATKEYDNAVSRYYEYNRDFKERSEIEYYKKAILELKEEGLL